MKELFLFLSCEEGQLPDVNQVSTGHAARPLRFGEPNAEACSQTNILFAIFSLNQDPPADLPGRRPILKGCLVKPTSILSALVLSAAPLLLSACAQSQAHHGVGRNDTAPMAHGAMGEGGKMDRETMCSIYAKMTPEERQATMEAHYGKATPEMMQRHNERLGQQCPVLAPQR